MELSQTKTDGMQSHTIIDPSAVLLRENKSEQTTWQRRILVFVLGYEGLGALLGGSLLMAGPDGRYMDIPVEIMHGTFKDFLLPGIILFVMGIITTSAFSLVVRKSVLQGIAAFTALIGMLIWFWIEIAILLQLHWLHAMWGLPVVFGLIAAIPLISASLKEKILLWCGIVSSLLYAVINITVPLQWKGYNVVSQVVSELSAVDAPTRDLWVILSTPYTLLMLAFSWGVYKMSQENRKLLTAAKLLIVYSALGFLWPFAPMHLRETLAAHGGNISDTLHILLGVVTEVIFFLTLGFAAAAFGRKFRIYSIFTVMLLFVFGILTFLEAPAISSNEPTPLIGLWERINIGLFLVWIVVLSIMLLRRGTAYYIGTDSNRTASDLFI
jgi:hypothetical protein